MNILLYGGGVDSTTLLAYLANKGIKDLIVIHSDYGQKAFKQEEKALNYFCSKYSFKSVSPKMDLTFASSCSILKNNSKSPSNNTKLELRNVILLSLASSYIASNTSDKVNTIYVGFHSEPKGKPYPDAVLYNVKGLEKVFKCCSGCNIDIKAPFVNKTRFDIYKLSTVLDKEIINKSYTCYDYKPCGKCPHCIMKKQIISMLENSK